MRQPDLRLLCMALAAVATGAGAGFAFLQAFPAGATPPAPAASPPPLPAAAWPLGTRDPAPAREVTPAPGPIHSAPPSPPPPVGEQATPATKKYAPTPRSKLAMRTPRIAIDAEALEETIADAGVPLPMRRWRLDW
jgi:hypothetical protein